MVTDMQISFRDEKGQLYRYQFGNSAACIINNKPNQFYELSKDNEKILELKRQMIELLERVNTYE